MKQPVPLEPGTVKRYGQDLMSDKSLEEIVHPDELIKKYHNPNDLPAGWNKVQLAAALRLIRHFLGDKWYSLVLQKIDDPSILEQPRYVRILKKPVLHFLNKSFWSGGVEGHAHVFTLGVMLKLLGLDQETSLGSKLERLRSTAFAETSYELRVASIYARNGFSVRFLKEKKGIKTPEFSIERDSIRTFVECKKRTRQGVGGLTDLLKSARDQIATTSKHGIVYLGLMGNPGYSSEELSEYTDAVRKTLVDLPEISCAILTWEHVVDAGQSVHPVMDARGIPNPCGSCPFPRELWCHPQALKGRLPAFIVDYGPFPPLIPEH